MAIRRLYILLQLPCHPRNVKSCRCGRYGNLEINLIGASFKAWG